MALQMIHGLENHRLAKPKRSVNRSRISIHRSYFGKLIALARASWTSWLEWLLLLESPISKCRFKRSMQHHLV
jgi:hypothetical protein